MFRKIALVTGDLCFRTFWIFFVLRMIGVSPVIYWSWVTITAPIWGGFIAILFISVLGAIIEEGKQVDEHSDHE